MNAIPGFRYLAWLTAACVAAFLAAGAFRFGSMVEPEQTDLLALLFFLALGLASQIGLIVAPWSLSQTSAVRIVVAVLMAPAAILLGLSAWEAAERLVAGNPMSPLVSALYLVGTFVYSLVHIQLAWRCLRHGRRL